MHTFHVALIHTIFFNKSDFILKSYVSFLRFARGLHVLVRSRSLKRGKVVLAYRQHDSSCLELRAINTLFRANNAMTREEKLTRRALRTKFKLIFATFIPSVLILLCEHPTMRMHKHILTYTQPCVVWRIVTHTSVMFDSCSSTSLQHDSLRTLSYNTYFRW